MKLSKSFSLGTGFFLWSWIAQAQSLTPIEELGKNVFFDEKISVPANSQACVSCHDPSRGWILPDSEINAGTVVAPGAKPGALGNIKPPSNAYASFSPPFTILGNGPVGGNFWDGRAEGCGATAGPCPVGSGPVSDTITVADLGASIQYSVFLGSVADQALNPFPNELEQNIRIKNVCQRVKTAPYKQLYDQAFGEAINCKTQPRSNPPVVTSFKRIAVALSAWQQSDEVNSFSSKRDDITQGINGASFTAQELAGRNLFYGRANCFFCHNGVPAGESPDPGGNSLRQLYTDHRYRNIGVPFNREIPGVAKGDKVGVSAHIGDDSVPDGRFKTPTLRNVGQGASAGFVKAYTHNGYFKSLKSLIQFYNSRDVLPRCETLGIIDATEEEALQSGCWPEPEFANPAGGIAVGNLGLNDSEIDAIVAFLETLSDQSLPSAP